MLFLCDQGLSQKYCASWMTRRPCLCIGRYLFLIWLTEFKIFFRFGVGKCWHVLLLLWFFVSWNLLKSYGTHNTSVLTNNKSFYGMFLLRLLLHPELGNMYYRAVCLLYCWESMKYFLFGTELLIWAKIRIVFDCSSSHQFPALKPFWDYLSNLTVLEGMLEARIARIFSMHLCVFTHFPPTITMVAIIISNDIPARPQQQ